MKFPGLVTPASAGPVSLPPISKAATFTELPLAIVVLDEVLRVHGANRAARQMFEPESLPDLVDRLTAVLPEGVIRRMHQEIMLSGKYSEQHVVDRCGCVPHKNITCLTGAIALADGFWVLWFSPGGRAGDRGGGTLKKLEAVRRGIARNLHDTMGQEVTLLKLALHRIRGQLQGLPEVPDEVLDQLAVSMAQADRIASRARAVAFDLRTDTMLEKGFSQAVADLVENFQRSSGISGGLEIAPGWVEPFSGMELHLYRICQELLANIFRHASATWFMVRLTWEGRVCVLEICDDGIGFDLAQNALPAKHVGLRSIQERVGFYQGQFQVVSRPVYDGTWVRVALPERREGVQVG